MSTLRSATVVLVALVVQVTVFADVRISGVAPELLVLLAVMLGYWTGPERGPTVAFFIGIRRSSWPQSLRSGRSERWPAMRCLGR